MSESLQQPAPPVGMVKRPWFLQSQFRLFITLFLLLALPAALLVVVVGFYVRRNLEEQAIAQNSVTARLIAETIQNEFYGLRKYVETFSRRTKLIEHTMSGDAPMLRTKLNEVVTQNAIISRAFVTDTNGTLLTDYPFTPALAGMNFKDRDWFAGAQGKSSAYISQIYHRTNMDNAPVVTVCFAITNGSQNVVGYLGAQLTIDRLSKWLEEIKLSSGSTVVLLDQSGQPALAQGNSQHPAAGAISFRPVLGKSAGTGVLADSSSQTDVLVSHFPVKSTGWTVAAYQSTADILKPVRRLFQTILVLFLPCLAGTLLLSYSWFKTLSKYELQRESAEEELNSQTANLKRTVQELQAVCYSIAHDLRGPLRAVRGLSIALKEDYAPALDDIGRDYVARLENSAKRMDDLTRDLLEYGRLSHVEITSEPVSLDLAIDRILVHFSDDIRVKRAEIEAKRPLPTVLAHPSVLEQVLGNLLSNALKFTAPGMNPCVRIWAEIQGGRVRVYIRDNGIGIDPAHHEKIFGIFERLHKQEVYPGTGIGLAIVRRGVERMGGSVTVESKPNAGSCFCIELPAGA